MNFLAQDSPDLQYPVKEVAKDMAKPRWGSWKKLKRVVRYLVKRKAVEWRYDWQDEPKRIEVITDSDWGGGKGDRKSTSAGVLMLGGHCVKTWSTSQGAIALSSAEAEFYAMVEGVLRAKWAVTVAAGMGVKGAHGALLLGTDSAAAKSFVARRGLGRMRHLEVRDL